jgi:hypothetical protein
VPLAYQSTADLMPAVETVTALQERSDFSARQATAAFWHWTKPVRDFGMSLIGTFLTVLVTGLGASAIGGTADSLSPARARPQPNGGW